VGIFVQGMSAMACLVIVLFFLRFWRGTGDRLFLIFAVAFSMMCVTRVVSAALGAAHVHSGYVYTLRFLAYLLIIAAIIDKNRPPSQHKQLAGEPPAS
jgi:alpha-D-ribose 1-methylphosphonate 5-triphosphate synthase subunit PhnI